MGAASYRLPTSLLQTPYILMFLCYVRRLLHHLGVIFYCHITVMVLSGEIKTGIDRVTEISYAGRDRER